MLEIVRDFAAILGQLGHHFLVQPNVHRRRVVHIAGIVEFCANSLRAARLLSKFISRIRSTIDVRQLSCCGALVASSSIIAATSIGDVGDAARAASAGADPDVAEAGGAAAGADAAVAAGADDE
jgi:hypothetical protein